MHVVALRRAIPADVLALAAFTCNARAWLPRDMRIFI